VFIYIYIYIYIYIIKYKTESVNKNTIKINWKIILLKKQLQKELFIDDSINCVLPIGLTCIL